MSTPRALLEVIAPNGQPRFVTPFVGNVSVTYLHNDIGTARLTVARENPRLRDILAEGQVYRIYSHRFPPFPCVLVEVRGTSGGVELGFKAAEYLLQRKVARQSIVMTAPAGVIGSEVLASGLRNTPVPLAAGELTASHQHFVELTYPDVYATLSGLAEKDDSAFWVDEHFRVHFRDSRGQDKSNSLALYENVHLSGVTVVRDYSEVVTHLVALGKEPSDANSPRPIKTLKLASAEVMARAATVDFNNYAEAEALVGPATEYLRAHRGPRVNIEATLLDVAGVWDRVKLGDVVTVVTWCLPGRSDHRCRIIGIEAAGAYAARLVLRVLPEPSAEPAVEWRLS